MIASLFNLAATSPSPFMDMLAAGLLPNVCGIGPCQLCDLWQLAHNVIGFLLKIAVPIAIAMLFYGGFLYITAGADGGNVAKGKKTIVSAAIGLLIAFGAYAIVNMFLLMVGFDMPASGAIRVWSDFPKCERYQPLSLVKQCGGATEGWCPRGSACQFQSGPQGFACVPTVAAPCGVVQGTCPNLQTCIPKSGGGFECVVSGINPGGPTGYCESSDACRPGEVHQQVIKNGTAACTCSAITGLSPDDRLSDSDSRAFLLANGFTADDINKVCTGQSNSTCLNNVSVAALTGAVDLNNRCPTCDIQITGGSEPGHAGGTNDGSHGGGDKLDYGASTALDNFIKNSGQFEYVGPRGSDQGYRDLTTGVIYYREYSPPHWDVCYVNCSY